MKTLLIVSLVLFLGGCSTTGFGTYAWKETADGKISIVPTSNPKYNYETRISDIRGYSWDNNLRWERDNMVTTWSNGQCKVVDETRENFVDIGTAFWGGPFFSRGDIQHRYVSGVVCTGDLARDAKPVFVP